jgi:hypothetical protein
MNKLFKRAALGLLPVGITLLTQGCAESNIVTQQKDPEVTAVYTAIAGSKNQPKTISDLIAEGKNPDLVASVATAAGIPLTTLVVALPGIPKDQLIADATAANNDPAAFTPTQQSTTQKKLHTVRNPY